LCLPLCQRSVRYVYVGLFLSFLSYSIDQFVCSFNNTTVSLILPLYSIQESYFFFRILCLLRSRHSIIWAMSLALFIFQIDPTLQIVSCIYAWASLNCDPPTYAPGSWWQACALIPSFWLRYGVSWASSHRLALTTILLISASKAARVTDGAWILQPPSVNTWVLGLQACTIRPCM
jgi:hypothetical protein